MKLQQLRFLAAVAQNDLNITAAAARLVHATAGRQQEASGLLEDELGFNIFVEERTHAREDHAAGREGDPVRACAPEKRRRRIKGSVGGVQG